jgi:hypothetical protein
VTGREGSIVCIIRPNKLEQILEIELDMVQQRLLETADGRVLAPGDVGSHPLVHEVRSELNLCNREFPFPSHPLLIPCSDFPEKRKFSAKAPYNRDLSKGKSDQREKFPVFFPVSREFGAEISSRATASTAIQSILI